MQIKNMLAPLLPLLAATAFAQASEDQAVWQQVDALNAAVFQRKDAQAMQALVDERLSYAHSNGQVENKAQMVANAVASRNQYRDIVVDRVSMTVADNTAVARHVLAATQTDQHGKESALRISVLQVWMRQPGKPWELLARQAVRVAAQ
jgi:hypothetical protein